MNLSSWLGFANEDYEFKAFHVVVRRHARDWSDVGKADPRAVSAGEGHVWCGGGAGLPSLTLVLEYIPPVLFKFSDSLVDRMAPGITVCSQIWPALMVNMACGEGLFEAVVVWVLGAPLSLWPAESSPYNTIIGRWWSSILETWPAHRTWYFSSLASMLESQPAPELQRLRWSHSSECWGWSGDSAGGSAWGYGCDCGRSLRSLSRREGW